MNNFNELFRNPISDYIEFMFCFFLTVYSSV